MHLNKRYLGKKKPFCHNSETLNCASTLLEHAINLFDCLFNLFFLVGILKKLGSWLNFLILVVLNFFSLLQKKN
jgi:hypothetical protein